MPFNPLPRLILASSSPARRALLGRLGLEFDCLSPEVDERALPGETAAQTAQRLAVAKARAVAALHPEALVIGADQVAECPVPGGTMHLGKPLTPEAAVAQLQQCSGQAVWFWTALALVGPARAGNGPALWQHLDRTCVQFRTLDRAEIERYVAFDQPLGCAGSFRAESLGISLFQALHSADPTALIGLPLLALCQGLRDQGWALP